MKYALICLLVLILNCASIPINSVLAVRASIEGFPVGNGTAFAVSSTDLITASHVCDMHGMQFVDKTGNIHRVALQLEINKQMFNIKIIKQDLITDLCLIRITEPILDPVTLALTDLDTKQFEKVYTIGFPAGSIAPIMTEGRITGVIVLENSESILIPVYLTSVPVYGGNSGGPLFNEDNQVIGVVVAANGIYHHSALVVPLFDLHEFLYEIQKPTLLQRILTFLHFN